MLESCIKRTGVKLECDKPLHKRFGGSKLQFFLLPTFSMIRKVLSHSVFLIAQMQNILLCSKN